MWIKVVKSLKEIVTITNIYILTRKFMSISICELHKYMY